MGELTTRFCDKCERTIKPGKAFVIKGSMYLLGGNNEDDSAIKEGDYCPACFDKVCNDLIHARLP